MSNDRPKKFLPLWEQSSKHAQQSVPNLPQEISASFSQAQQSNSHRSEVRNQPQEHATKNKQYFSEIIYDEFALLRSTFMKIIASKFEYTCRRICYITLHNNILLYI